MRVLRFAVVGCGRVFAKHADALTGPLKGRAALVGVCDVDPSRAEAAGTRYGVPPFADLDSMLRALGPTVDCVSILTPSGLHARDAITAASHAKHVVVEKPMALTLADADAMIEACDRAGVKLFVIKQNRCNPAVVALRKAFEEERFGKIVMGTVRSEISLTRSTSAFLIMRLRNAAHPGSAMETASPSTTRSLRHLTSCIPRWQPAPRRVPCPAPPKQNGDLSYFRFKSGT